ncbi:MAG: hypothetical protein ABSD38_28260 [Syntrophorhabdales bacterium]|jgi:hypothetical protein
MSNAFGETTRNSVLAAIQKDLKDLMSGGMEAKSDLKDPLGLLILVPEELIASGSTGPICQPAGNLF